MVVGRPINDNIPQHKPTKRRLPNFFWKMEYFPRKVLGLVGAEAMDQREARPLRVLTIKLHDEI